jgi:FkbM family methyltransferase
MNISFDIGANIGAWSLANSSHFDKIVAVEANPDIFSQLVRNTINRNIECINYAVSDAKTDTVDFYKCSATTISTLNEKWLVDPSSRFYNQYTYTKIQTPVISLDTMIARYGKPALIKVDVEGAEHMVLRSLSQPVETLCFEWASETNVDVTYPSLTYLQSIGFTKFYIQNGDAYTFRPSFDDYKDITNILRELEQTKHKVDWGMIWCTI